MWKKEKMLVTSIFSFSHNVFKRLHSQDRYRSELCGKVLYFYHLSDLKAFADDNLDVVNMFRVVF